MRDEIDAVVAAKLTEQPTVVVGHSLGSVTLLCFLDPQTGNRICVEQQPRDQGIEVGKLGQMVEAPSW